MAKKPAVAGVEIALRRQPLGQQDGVLVQFHVVVIDRRPARLPADGGAVHQLPGADQHAVHEDRVIRRDQQIAVRHVVGEGVAFDADRRHGLRSGMRGQIDAAMAEPSDRARDVVAIRYRENKISDDEVFDFAFARRGGDMRASQIANRLGGEERQVRGVEGRARGQDRGAALGQRPAQVRQVEHHVAGEAQRDARRVQHAHPIGTVVDDGVDGDRHRPSGVRRAFLAISDDGRVMGVGTLLDDVAGDRGVAAVRAGRCCSWRCCCYRRSGCW